MPKLLRHRGSAAPWLCSVTFFFFYSHTQPYWNRFVHRGFWAYGSHSTTEFRGDLIYLHTDNTLTHGITREQQATVVVFCYYILHFVCKKRGHVGPVIPFPAQVSRKILLWFCCAKSLRSMIKILRDVNQDFGALENPCYECTVSTDIHLQYSHTCSGSSLDWDVFLHSRSITVTQSEIYNHWTTMKFDTDIQAPQKMNPADFCDPLTSHPAPPAGGY